MLPSLHSLEFQIARVGSGHPFLSFLFVVCVCVDGDSAFKKRAPRAIKEIKAYAQKAMRTTDVRIDAGLNKAVWSHGVRNVQNKIRVRMQRKRNEDEESGNKLYTLVSFLDVSDNFEGLQTKVVDDE